VNFPIPKRFVQPGDIVGYGYEEEALFVSEIIPERPSGTTALRRVIN